VKEKGVKGKKHRKNGPKHKWWRKREETRTKTCGEQDGGIAKERIRIGGICVREDDVWKRIISDNGERAGDDLRDAR